LNNFAPSFFGPGSSSWAQAAFLLSQLPNPLPQLTSMSAEGQNSSSDVWDVKEFITTEKSWSSRNFIEKLTFVAILFVKLVLMILLLYSFIISLGLMSNAFRILGGKAAGRTFRNSDLFDNPLAGLVLGIIVTVLVQSSSTSSSIIVTMTAGDLIDVKNAVPMIMGANIGTSVTNTIVSLGAFRDKNEYRRAFAGATVHDCFNFLSVLLLLPIEAATGMLMHLSSAICDGMDITDEEEKGTKTDFLKKLTKPIASRLLAIDKGLITKIAQEDDEDKLKEYEARSIIKHKQKDDQHIFLNTPMGDGVAGLLMVVVSLFFLTICLMLLVKLLQTIFRGRIALWFRAAINLETPRVPFLANYILIVFGAIITILFQSSSVTTSTLTPLVGIGLVRIEKMFAFTVGANIGTTITGVLSALVSDKRKTGLTVAFAHVLFNVIGTLIWYPVPIVRCVPIEAAKLLGNIASDVRWFPIAYILVVFAGLPILLLALSIASPWAAAFVGVPLLLSIFALFVLASMRVSKPERLPGMLLSNPKWLPPSLHTGGPDESAAKGDQVAGGGDADLGAGHWQAAPAAWGTAWLVVLALAVVIPNCQWAFIKYPSWDKRDHFGIGAWVACSNAFEEDMVWAPPTSNCTEHYLEECGGSIIQDCSHDAYSRTDGVSLAYQESWASCRERCSSSRWEAWCRGLSCGGGQHTNQCSNVTKAIQGRYDVEYGPAGQLAWAAGDRCRDVGVLCPGMEGSLKVIGDLSVVGLVGAGIGLMSLILSRMFGKLETAVFLKVSLAGFVFSWCFLLVAWASFADVSEQNATCIVEAESHNGVVWAHGQFHEIFSAGAYAFGVLLGCWLLLFITMLLVVVRMKQNYSDRDGGALPSADLNANKETADEKTANDGDTNDVRMVTNSSAKKSVEV